MEIILIRYCYSRWGVMGALYVGGLCICHTCEHPDRHLSVGKYDVKKEREKLRIVGSPQGGYHCLPVFRPGNGPFVYRDGSIIVGNTGHQDCSFNRKTHILHSLNVFCGFITKKNPSH